MGGEFLCYPPHPTWSRPFDDEPKFTKIKLNSLMDSFPFDDLYSAILIPPFAFPIL
jgi:hypothetical protein